MDRSGHDTRARSCAAAVGTTKEAALGCSSRNCLRPSAVESPLHFATVNHRRIWASVIMARRHDTLQLECTQHRMPNCCGSLGHLAAMLKCCRFGKGGRKCSNSQKTSPLVFIVQARTNSSSEGGNGVRIGCGESASSETLSRSASTSSLATTTPHHFGFLAQEQNWGRALQRLPHHQTRSGLECQRKHRLANRRPTSIKLPTGRAHGPAPSVPTWTKCKCPAPRNPSSSRP